MQQHCHCAARCGKRSENLRPRARKDRYFGDGNAQEGFIIDVCFSLVSWLPFELAPLSCVVGLSEIRRVFTAVAGQGFGDGDGATSTTLMEGQVPHRR